MKIYPRILGFLGLVVFSVTVKAQQNVIKAAPNVTVKGRVADAKDGSTLLGATVSLLQGRQKKSLTATDKDGKFTVQVAGNAVLVFSLVGYKDEKVVLAAGKTDLSIALSTKPDEMDEVVVIGYQERKRATTTGSAVTISGKDIQDVPVASFTELLQGKVAGMNVQNNNGTPGMMGTIQIRGLSNLNIVGSGSDAYLTPTSPLYVVDGIPYDVNEDFQYGFQSSGPGINPIAMIPPEDIKEIQVLKDAQATSIYGSKGAYGVILITTKRGNSNVPIVQYTSNYFVNVAPQLNTVIGGKMERWSRIMQIMSFDSTYADALLRINSTPFLSDSLNPYYNNSTDWQKFFIRSTSNQQHNVSFSGGNQSLNYKVNTGLYDEKGIIKNTGVTRYNLDMNMQYQPSKEFKLFAQVSSSLVKNSKGSGNALSQSGVATAGNASSLLPSPSLFTASNEALAAIGVIDDNKTANIRTNVGIDFQPLKSVRVSTTVGYSYRTGTEDTYKPGILNNNAGTVYAYNAITTNFYNRNTIAFFKTIGDHNFNANVFNEISTSQVRGNSLTQTGTPNDQVQGPFGYATSGGTSNASAGSRSAGFAGSFSYNYKSKYVLDLSYRLDGTSTSGPDAPLSKNPAIGLRWNFGKEKLMQKFSKWLDYASVRGSWGKNIVPTGSIYDVYGRYSLNSSGYNGSPTISIDTSVIPNTFLVPSVTSQWTGGIEMGFLNGKVSVTVDAYYKQVDKQLRSKAIANINGFGNVSTNETSLVNYGYEFSIQARPLNSGSKLKWTVSFNGAVNHDVLAALPDGVRQLIVGGGNTSQPTLYRLGINTFSNVLFHTRGIFATDANIPVDPLTGLRYRVGTSNAAGAYFRAGDPYWTDLNGDYILDGNDLVITGNSQPRFVGGFSNSFIYKQFGFSVNASYTIGRDILNNVNASRFTNYSDPLSLSAGSLVPIDSYSFWRMINNIKSQGTANAVYPNPYDYTRAALISAFRTNQTLFQEDGSYVKINTATLSYNLPKKLTGRFGITSMRVYCSANNIYTFSFYKGTDPENVSALGRDDNSQYPMRRSYILGLNVQF